MDETNSLIYGLEFQARALAAPQADCDIVRFLIGTQVLKQANNQIHLVEVSDDTEQLSTRVFQHSIGEIWRLTCSPHNTNILATCYSTFKGANPQWMIQSSLLSLPSLDGDLPDENEKLDILTSLETEKYGNEVKTTEFNPIDSTKVACVVDSSVVVFDVGQASAFSSTEINSENNILNGKAQVQIPGKGSKLTTGKWSMEHQGNQFITLCETTIKAWDIRDSNQNSWAIEGAHKQLIRDLDSNPNKQFHIASCGDDGALKIWDYRNIREPVFARNDHSHWIWSVRYNTFHDQLLLTTSSDSRALLTCAVSVSSESEAGSLTEGEDSRDRLPEGVLHSYEVHEDSVYCGEWSPVDPWTLATLSYDGRLVISKLPRRYKQHLLL